MLEQYLDELSSEGELHSEGSFTLAVDQARDKLAKFRFLHIVEGILSAISACLMGSSQWVKVERTSRGWTILHSPIECSREQLSGLLDRIFDARQPLWLREMGLAFNSLYPRHCQGLRWLPQSHVEGRFLDGKWCFTDVSTTIDFPRIEIDTSSFWRRPLNWVQQRWSGVDELDVLRYRTLWSSVPIRFPDRSGYELNPPQAPATTWAVFSLQSNVRELQLPDFQGIPERAFRWQRKNRGRASLQVCLVRDWSLGAEILIVFRGLTLARHRVNWTSFPFRAVLNTDALDLDASRAHIVVNQKFKQRMTTVRGWIVEGIGQWLKQLDPSDEDARQLVFSRFQQLLEYKELREILGGRPLLNCCDGSKVSLGEFERNWQSHRQIHFSSLAGPKLLQGRLLLTYAMVPLLPKRFKVNPPSNCDEFLPLPSVDKAHRFCQQALELRGNFWEAQFLLPANAPVGTKEWAEIQVSNQGQLMLVWEQDLFAGIPWQVVIQVEHSFLGPLSELMFTIQREIAKALPGALKGWIKTWLPDERDIPPYHLLCLILAWLHLPRQGALPDNWKAWIQQLPLEGQHAHVLQQVKAQVALRGRGAGGSLVG